MMLHGSWTYGIMKANGGDFVTGGAPRLHELPADRRRQGRPRATPSATRASTCRSPRRPPTAEKEIAKKFFNTAVLDDAENKQWIDTGQRADRQGHRQPARLASKDEDFLKFVYGIASNAKIFAQSWDQALSPTAAETLLDNIAKLFQLSDHPAAVRRQHEQGHRPVTALAPPAAARATARSTRAGGGRSGRGRRGWRCRPWLIFVAFGVVPLLGVLALSFTTWDGIGAIHPAGLTELAGRAHRSRAAARALGDLRDHGPVRGWSRPRSACCSASSWPAASATAAFLAVLYFIPLLLSSAAHRDHLQGAARPELRPRRRARIPTADPGLARRGQARHRRASSSSCPGSSSRSTR